ncbi:MAG: polyphosphate polymerase domain-containing protein [Pedosphaera sp.]|nr:polyphosphate polymerase domain-containing protein [Pedosphaera sp.]MST00082.1 polyphosphate polymerase domain-containing protein [Pedosphaera sp.]
MSQDHHIQAQRFELKYIVSEETALRIRDFISAYLDLDDYGVGKPHNSYPVHSLYLDSDRMRIYWETVNGNKNRYKLRLRFYHDDPEAPVFFEIKRRENDAILKQRAAVRRDAVDWVLRGHLPPAGYLISNDAKSLGAMQRFSELLKHVDATPKAHIAYLREAWVHPDNNSVRVTMDREVRCAVETTARLVAEMDKPVTVFGKSVVLEVKFTGRFPKWFGEMTRVFGFKQCSAAKYVDGVTLMGDQQFHPGLVRQRKMAALDPAIQAYL